MQYSTNIYKSPSSLSVLEVSFAHYNFGNALQQEGKVNEAIAQYQQVLQINPDFAGAQNNLGNALLQKGKVDEAITQFRQALQINPDAAEAHYNLGDALFPMKSPSL